MSCEALKEIYTVQPDLLVEVANIAALAFCGTEFKLLAQKASSCDAAFVLPKTQYQFLASKIGSNNLSITFKNKKNVDKNINFRVCFFPKIATMTLSGYCSEGIAHLIYTPFNENSWLNGKGCKRNSPDGIGEKFEFLAAKFYPFFEEFFLG